MSDETGLADKPKKRRGNGNRAHNAKDDKAEAERTGRRARCVTLRNQGWSWKDIAEALQYADAGNAQKDYRIALRDIVSPIVEEVRAEAEARYLKVIRAHALKSARGSVRDSEIILRAEAERLKMHGAIAPTQVRIGGPGPGPMGGPVPLAVSAPVDIDELLELMSQNETTPGTPGT